MAWRINMWRDSFKANTNVTWLIQLWHASSRCDKTHPNVTWLIQMWHDLFKCDTTRWNVICRIHTYTHLLPGFIHEEVLPCVAVCCSVLQCVAVCCSVLQCVAVCYNVPHLLPGFIDNVQIEQLDSDVKEQKRMHHSAGNEDAESQSCEACVDLSNRIQLGVRCHHMRLCVCVCVCVCVRERERKRMRLCVCVNVWHPICICVCVHIYLYIYVIHTHTKTQTHTSTSRSMTAKTMTGSDVKHTL